MRINLNNKCLGKYGNAGFTLTEAIVVIIIASLLVSIAMLNLSKPFRKNRFKSQIHNFVTIMHKAATSASQTGRRYEVIIDIAEQQYTLREITSDNLAEVMEEEIIDSANFSKDCYADYVLFDQREMDTYKMTQDTETLMYKFRVGPAGWNYGGKIVFLDRDNTPYSVIVSTLSRTVSLKKGDVEILTSKTKDELPF